MAWDQWRDDYNREDERNDAARDWRYQLAEEHRREETVTDDIRGDHDSPWSYGPWEDAA